MEKTIIGWREYVDLPEWGVKGLKAKADSGARTSAIDVSHLEELPDDRVRFEIVVDRRHPERRVVCEADIVRRTRVKSAHGTVHERIMVLTTMRLGPIEKSVEIGLVSRHKMLCRMLIGRKALEPEFLVDAGERYLFGTRRKRGRSRSVEASPTKPKKHRATPTPE